MVYERYAWYVGVERDGVWDCIGSHEIRAEAEAELQAVRSVYPTAFLVRVTLTRMDQARTTSVLTVV